MLVISMFTLVIGLSVVWGIIYALILQKYELPSFLAKRRPWVTVVGGVGVQVLIMGLLGPCVDWWIIPCCFIGSGIPIIWRSLQNEHAEEKALRERLR